jgi:folate-binding protein YgfZ
MFSLEGYRAALAAGGLVRRTDRGVLAVSGADRASWLQGLVTNDVAALREGESCYAAYLTPQGRMISDMNVFAERGRMLLDVPAPLAGSLRDRLDGLIFAEDVTVSDESARLRVWTVIDTPEGLSPQGSTGLSPHVGESLPPELERRAEIDLETFEVIRIERGVPQFLTDMDETTIPLEAGIEDRAISFTKGCYVGQEIIVRVTHRGGGRVAKRLVRWHAVGDAAVVPPRDAKLFAGEREAGRVTSAAFSPGLDRVVGMGYLQRDYAEPGLKVSVVWSDSRIEGVVQ